MFLINLDMEPYIFLESLIKFLYMIPLNWNTNVLNVKQGYEINIFKCIYLEVKISISFIQKTNLNMQFHNEKETDFQNMVILFT